MARRLGTTTQNGVQVTTSVRLLSTAAALGVGLLTTSLLAQGVATAESSTGKKSSDGEAGQGLSICRPVSFTGQIAVECQVAPNGESANGSAQVVVEDHSDEEESEDS